MISPLPNHLLSHCTCVINLCRSCDMNRSSTNGFVNLWRLQYVTESPVSFLYANFNENLSWLWKLPYWQRTLHRIRTCGIWKQWRSCSTQRVCTHDMYRIIWTVYIYILLFCLFGVLMVDIFYYISGTALLQNFSRGTAYTTYKNYFKDVIYNVFVIVRASGIFWRISGHR